MKSQQGAGDAQPGAAPTPNGYAPYYEYGNNNYPQQPQQPGYYPQALPAPAQYQPSPYGPPHPQPGCAQDYPMEATQAPQLSQGHPLYQGPPPAQNPAPNKSGGQDPVPAHYDYTVPQTYQEVRKYEGSNDWATGMWSAPCKEPGMCCASFFCPCCCTFIQRRKLLVHNWENYRCCAGTCAYACCACFNNNNCGSGAPFCLAMETLFCLPCAVHANRYMVMRHYGLRNDCCDLVLMWSACVCQIVSCILGDGCLESIADIWYYIVISCMLAQHEHQMRQYPYPTPTTMV